MSRLRMLFLAAVVAVSGLGLATVSEVADPEPASAAECNVYPYAWKSGSSTYARSLGGCWGNVSFRYYINYNCVSYRTQHTYGAGSQFLYQVSQWNFSKSYRTKNPGGNWSGCRNVY